MKWKITNEEQWIDFFDSIRALNYPIIIEDFITFQNEYRSLFIDEHVYFIKRKEIGDYITASTGNTNAIREICSLLIGLTGNFDQVVDLRMKFKGEYKEYLDLRNVTDTEVVIL